MYVQIIIISLDTNAAIIPLLMGLVLSVVVFIVKRNMSLFQRNKIASKTRGSSWFEYNESS